MQAYFETEVFLPVNHHLNIQLPDEIPAGRVRIAVIYEKENNIQLLPIDLSHINYLEQLPSHHKDPFDRIIIARAIIIEGMSIISIDHAVVDYPVNIVW
jgi:PIN domain nuclease of toxin-antitoxin system